MATVKIDDRDGLSLADQELARRAETIMLRLVLQLTTMIGSLPASARVRMADGRVLKGSDIKQLWNDIKFVITARSFGPGYGGSFDFATKTSFIRHDTVTGWGIFPSGAEFITLHELIHSCKPGERVRQKMWKRYRKRSKNVPNMLDLYRDSPEFSEVEEYCYVGAREIMKALGIPVFQGTFQHGYEYGDLDR